MENIETAKHYQFSIKFKNSLPWLIPVFLILIWQVACNASWVNETLLPSPIDVVTNGVKLFKKGELQENMSISLYRATAGLLIGGGLGFILGFINGVSHTARLLFDSTIQMLRNIPHLALIPLIILWLGIGESAKISLVALGCLFPMYINTYHGITSVDPKLIEMGKSYELSKKDLFTKIIFPGALPTILMGLRYALGVMWTSLIVAETISASSGIGYMSTNAEQFLDMKTIILCILIYALLGKLSDFIAKNFEDIFLNWRVIERGQSNDSKASGNN
ncbi:ABC transporter permease subunit [Liquorilactobacillus cacaonum]|uniref:ABC transporter permease n=1 Tax=Liquorilactobacillus cacaonum DSM 21116 TaxID=1423729 RepID=A0A0R2CLY4_9LACO|nr:ABC transporter permease subunit [Liquorilactobacillus cacaonum]KRM90964.1 ABC transporter permease [Liquorilactobacillus cacaonum DSM 21116]